MIKKNKITVEISTSQFTTLIFYDTYSRVFSYIINQIEPCSKNVLFHVYF